MIESSEVERAQQQWARGVVHIGTAATWAESHARTRQLVQELYQVDEPAMLFSPTKAAQTAFRRTLDGAVSYFVGNNPSFPEDKGFALQPWSSVRFQNLDIVCSGGVAMVMGHYFFGQSDGSELKAEFSFVYVRDDSGDLKIQLHHSALPFDVLVGNAR